MHTYNDRFSFFFSYLLVTGKEHLKKHEPSKLINKKNENDYSKLNNNKRLNFNKFVQLLKLEARNITS